MFSKRLFSIRPSSPPINLPWKFTFYINGKFRRRFLKDSFKNLDHKNCPVDFAITQILLPAPSLIAQLLKSTIFLCGNNKQTVTAELSVIFPLH